MPKTVLRIEDDPKPIIKTSLLDSEYLNLPDLEFYQQCHQLYHINRGVFNTIDYWFFGYGVIHIIYRRIYILAFLDFVKETYPNPTPQKFIKFGHGGLTVKLNEFIKAKKLNHNYVTR
ncbi:hypothetical protein [Neobacillus sp. Marseille-QA0830]